MKRARFHTSSAQDTIKLARKIASLLKKGDVIGLFGELGSGKTTFVKGLADGLGLKSNINSPSFVILKIYSLKKNSPKKLRNISLCHFDLYRLRSLKELEDIGYEDFIDSDALCVIEWADRADRLLPKNYLKINIKIKTENSRVIDITAYGDRYCSLLNRIKT